MCVRKNRFHFHLQHLHNVLLLRRQQLPTIRLPGLSSVHSPEPAAVLPGDLLRRDFPETSHPGFSNLPQPGLQLILPDYSHLRTTIVERKSEQWGLTR